MSTTTSALLTAITSSMFTDESTDQSTGVPAMTDSSIGMMSTTAAMAAGKERTVADDLHFAMSAVVGPIIVIFGIAGNILSIVTWCRPNMRSSTGRYLTGQSFADLGLLILFILTDSIQFWCPSVVFSPSFGVFFSYIGFPFFFLTVVLSVWYTVGVTVDRYIMVCWVTKAKKLCSEKRANFGLLLITVNSFIINLPHFATFTPVFADDTGNNSSPQVPAFKKTEFGGGAGGLFYDFWIHCIILILIPWTSVLFMNVQIIRKISESNRKMADKKTSQSQKKSKQSETQITKLLLTVTFTFLFFIGTQCIIQCVWMQQPAGADKHMVETSWAIGKMGVVLNSSTNFILYCLTGRRFRMELMSMFGLTKDSFTLSSLDHSSSTGKSSSSAATSSTSGI